MSKDNDDRLGTAAARLAQDISPQRDLWPGIENAITAPRRSRWMPLFAQAAGVVMLVGASSLLTYFVVKDEQRVIEVVRPVLTTETVAFDGRSLLGLEYNQALGRAQTKLDRELERVSPATRADVERNLAVIRQAIADIDRALEKEPDNELLQELLSRAYREELSIMQRVGSLTQQTMRRQDI